MALSTDKIFIAFALILVIAGLTILHKSSTLLQSLQSSAIDLGGSIDQKNVSTASVETASNETLIFHHGHQNQSNFLPRVLAFVFPQFHQDSLNDRVWGEGFTDWDSLRKAPLKNRLGLEIPRPTELGYYNYSDTEPRKRQGQLANEYGVDGFAFHHYWFYDENYIGPNLHSPLVNMLKDGHPDTPFALHWCAMKWIVTWQAEVNPDFKFPAPDIIQKQNFPEDEEKIKMHYEWLKQFFHHPNYIKVDGKPLFMLYEKKRGALHVLRKLRELAKEDGFPGLYITVGITKPHEHLLQIDRESVVRTTTRQKERIFGFGLFDKVLTYPNPADWSENRTLDIPSWCTENRLGKRQSNVKRTREMTGIISSFDNTPRRNVSTAFLFATGEPDDVVERFRISLDAALYYEACCFPDVEQRSSKLRTDDDRFIVINAMNEWAEGMMLEPSSVYGRKFLETVRDTKNAISMAGCSRS